MDRECESFLSLSRRISVAAYGLVITIGLSFMVLLVHRPAIADSELVNAIYDDVCTDRLVAHFAEPLRDLFTTNMSECDYPWRDIAQRFVDSSSREDQSRLLLRYLNAQGMNRERNFLLLTRNPSVVGALRGHIASRVERHATITLPVIRSQISLSEFAFGASVVFLCIHVYLMLHRQYLSELRRVHKGNNVGIVADASLLTATPNDLAVFPSAGRRNLILTAQGLFLYASPLILVGIIAAFLFHAHGPIQDHLPAVAGAFVAVVDAAVVWCLWFSWQAFKSELPLFRKRVDSG